ncbi:phospholipase A2 inhibitor and Ly6/PLAUR domain-containing protein [Pelodiscus sinensis]|uniref:phospholipase A2 inhibitor and Ly6/PLAUR domain-containing protein n=1 Tax=Pelodiscus sinensis TaxID=13735 RepID=UPI003F6C11C1
MQGSLALGLLAVFLAAVKGQDVCSSCTGSPEQCLSNMQNCPVNFTEGACVFTLENTFSGEQDTGLVYAACVQNRTACRASLTSLTVEPDKQVRSNTVCCRTSKCNQQLTLAVPQRSAQNSRQCPACVGETAEQCRSDARVSCSGPEDRCFDFAGTLVNSTTTQVWRGCATESICQLQINETFFYSNQTYTLTSTRCTNRAPPTVTQALASSPLLAGLLLLRQLL